MWRSRERHGERQCFAAWLPLIFLLNIGNACLGATNGPGEELKLRPPRGEMPPTFWELHGPLVIAAGVLAILVIGLLIWYLTRPRPVVQVPPETRARKELEILAGKPADREVLSRTSQIVKRYLTEVFGLPAEEMTTKEFCGAIDGNAHVGLPLAERIRDFLIRCDTMKFAPGPPQDFLGEAVNLVNSGESRRQELKSAEAASKAVERSKA